MKKHSAIDSERLIQKRAAIAVGLFLLELEPTFMGAPSMQSDFCDSVATFMDAKGTPITIAISIHPSEEELYEDWILRLSSNRVNVMTTSNIPFLICVVDVRREDVRFNGASELVFCGSRARNGMSDYSLMLRKNSPLELQALRHEIMQHALTHRDGALQAAHA